MAIADYLIDLVTAVLNKEPLADDLGTLLREHKALMALAFDYGRLAGVRSVIMGGYFEELSESAYGNDSNGDSNGNGTSSAEGEEGAEGAEEYNRSLLLDTTSTPTPGTNAKDTATLDTPGTGSVEEATELINCRMEILDLVAFTIIAQQNVANERSEYLQQQIIFPEILNFSWRLHTSRTDPFDYHQLQWLKTMEEFLWEVSKKVSPGITILYPLFRLVWVLEPQSRAIYNPPPSAIQKVRDQWYDLVSNVIRTCLASSNYNDPTLWQYIIASCINFRNPGPHWHSGMEYLIPTFLDGQLTKDYLGWHSTMTQFLHQLPKEDLSQDLSDTLNQVLKCSPDKIPDQLFTLVNTLRSLLPSPYLSRSLSELITPAIDCFSPSPPPPARNNDPTVII